MKYPHNIYDKRQSSDMTNSEIVGIVIFCAIAFLFLGWLFLKPVLGSLIAFIIPFIIMLIVGFIILDKKVFHFSEKAMESDEKQALNYKFFSNLKFDACEPSLRNNIPLISFKDGTYGVLFKTEYLAMYNGVEKNNVKFIEELINLAKMYNLDVNIVSMKQMYTRTSAIAKNIIEVYNTPNLRKIIYGMFDIADKLSNVSVTYTLLKSKDNLGKLTFDSFVNAINEKHATRNTNMSFNICDKDELFLFTEQYHGLKSLKLDNDLETIRFQDTGIELKSIEYNDGRIVKIDNSSNKDVITRVKREDK